MSEAVLPYLNLAFILAIPVLQISFKFWRLLDLVGDHVEVNVCAQAESVFDNLDAHCFQIICLEIVDVEDEGGYLRPVKPKVNLGLRALGCNRGIAP